MNPGYDILFISPYKELGEKVKAVSDEMGFKIRVEVANLPLALDVAKKYEKEGIDLIISRGGTALKIKEIVDIPVLEMKVTGYDVSKSIYEALRYSGNIAVIGSANIAYGSSQLAAMLNVKITELPIQKFDDYKEVLKKAMTMDIDTIVGDVVSVQMARELGLKGFLIQSEDREAILNTILEARQICEIRRKEITRMEQLKIILQYAHSGIVAIDSEGMITLFNSEAEKIMSYESETCIGKHIDKLFPQLKLTETLNNRKIELNELCQINDEYFALHKVPITVNDQVYGAVGTMQKLEQIQKIERKARRELAVRGHVATVVFDDIIGESEKIKHVIDKAKKYSNVDSFVLITGETGCGKELFAQSIHNESLRKDGPFVAVNCAALPQSLLESELFGYVGGAFTGANIKGKLGLFEQAHSGTIFLDEIGEVPLSVQTRLLRVIQEGKVQRIGDDKLISINVRVICATNQDLSKMVKQGQFRADLYYRINILHLQLPTLKERTEDIIPLARHFINKFCEKNNKPSLQGRKEDLEVLCRHSWPGNIRELQNVIERLVVEKQDLNITKKDLEELLQPSKETTFVYEENNISSLTQKAILHSLQVTGNNKAKAAKMLGVDRSTLWRKMKQYNIEGS